MNAQKKAAHWAQDLLDEIRFDVENGKIWFHGERMLLSHAYALWQFREDLIESLGMARAKRFLLRYGYYAGMQDAQIAKKIRPHQSIEEAFAAGPQLHTIRGMVKVTPRLLSFDVEKGLFKGTFDWHDSFEVSYHKKKHGISKEPICWTLLGYASGYTSYFLGKEIAFKETLCEAMGHDHCHIIGKTVDEWEGETDLERSFLPDSIEEELFSLRNEINELKQQNHHDLLDSTQLFDAVGESAAFRQVCRFIGKSLAKQGERAARRRNRRGQRSLCQRPACRQPPRRPAFCGRELRLHSARIGGIGIIRRGKRRVYRRRAEQARQIRARPFGHYFFG